MQIVFLLYEGMTALDFIGPHEVLCRLPEVIIKRVALQQGLIQTESMQLALWAEYAIEEVIKADVLVIPGGGKATTLREFPEILHWIQQIHTTTTWTTSVCTGSLILGAAGLLFQQKATSHWAVLSYLEKWGAIPVAERVVESGKIITAAGVSAGIDMGLLLAQKLCGQDIAERIQLGIEYDPRPPFDRGALKKARPEIIKELSSFLQEKFEKP